MGVPKVGVGVLDPVVEHGVFNGHAGLIGKERQEMQVIRTDRLAGNRVVNNDNPEGFVPGHQGNSRKCGYAEMFDEAAG